MVVFVLDRVAMQNLTHTHQEEIAQLRQQHQAALRSIQAPLERQLQASQQVHQGGILTFIGQYPIYF